MRLPELQDNNKKAKKLRSKRLPEGWEDIKHVLYYQSFSYILKVIRSELISRHYNNPHASHFGIEKTWELIARKYYWPMLQQDIEAYVKSCDVYLVLKAVGHKPYGDLQLLPVLTHWWKDLSIDFVTGLPVLANEKVESYNSILVIVNRLTKMVYYIQFKVMIDTPNLAEVIINIVMHHHRVPKSIVMYWDSFFISKFWFLLCYFLKIQKSYQ